MQVTIGMGKGGSGKTLTALYLAFGLARRGDRVLVIDADANNASARDWRNNTEGWPGNVSVVRLDGPLVDDVRSWMPDFDHLLIDTGPGHPDVMRQALAVTGELLVPVGPSPIEMRQVASTLRIAAEVDSFTPVSVRVLLTRMQAGTLMARHAREYLEGQGIPVMDATITLRVSYPMAWGSVPDDLGDYEAVLAELLEEPEAAETPA